MNSLQDVINTLVRMVNRFRTWPHKLTVSATEPPNPREGDVWIDISGL